MSFIDDTPAKNVEPCGQYHKRFTNVIYDSRAVLCGNLLYYVCRVVIIDRKTFIRLAIAIDAETILQTKIY